MASEDAQRATAFHYLRAPDFRAAYADGAIGSWNAKQHLMLSFFSELVRLPEMQIAAPPPAGQAAAPPVVTIGGPGGIGKDNVHVERLVSFQIAMDASFVKELRDFLDKKLAELEQAFPPAPEPGSAP